MHAATRCVLLAVFALCAACSVHAAPAYPVSVGEEHTAQAAAKSTATVTTLYGEGDMVTVHSIAYEIVSVRQPWQRTNTDYCLPSKKDVYTYSLVLRAKSTSDTQYERDYNLADVTGTSILSQTIRVATPSIFAVLLTNPSTDSRCVLKVQLRIQYTVGSTPAPNSLAPSIDSISPLLLSANKAGYSFFALHHKTREAAREAVNDTVSLVNAEQTCSASRGTVLTYTTQLPPTITTGTDRMLLSVYESVLYPAGVYRVCHRAGKDVNGSVPATSTELGVVVVYAVNPGFYTLLSSNGAENHIHVGEPFAIRFYGSGLDSRATGDSAKLVDADDECSTGRAAGGVPVATQLQPGGAYGPRVTQTMWNLTIKRAGSYKVCYRRGDTREWVDVPYLDDTPMPPPPTPSDKPDVIPVPTSPADKAECPMAPQNTPQSPWVNYHGIELVLTERKIAPEFLQKLSDAFCIPRSALYVVRLNHTAQGNQVIYFTIDCETVRVGDKVVCSTQERYNYIAYLNTTQSEVLKSIGVVSATGLTSMIAFDDDPVAVVRRYSMLGLVAVSLILLAAAALAVVAVQRYRENRAYFVQFGIDENDVNDMYDVSEPSQAVATAPPAGERTKPVRGAVIEMEE